MFYTYRLTMQALQSNSPSNFVLVTLQMELKQLTIRASMALSVLVVMVIALSTLPQAESRPSITDGWVQYNNRFGIPNERRSDQIADVVSKIYSSVFFIMFYRQGFSICPIHHLLQSSFCNDCF